jgi:hypothetical protein
MSVLETDRLAELLNRKHHCLSELLEFGRQQLVLVDGGDITQLLRVLAAKQQLLMQLDGLERQLDPFRLQDPETRQWRTPVARAKAAEMITSTENLFREILLQEKRSEQRLRERRDDAAARLSGAHFASQARGAYAAELTRPIARLDLCD